MRYTKRIMALTTIILTCAAGILFPSCSEEPGFDERPMFPGEFPGDFPGNGGSMDDGDQPGFDSSIVAWEGQMADDAAMDAVGSNEDIFWEANSFGHNGGITVTVEYAGGSANVTASDNAVRYYTDGAYVTIDMLTGSAKNVEIIVSGKSADGQLKIYGEKKFKLTLSGVELTSTKGPAINNQCKKRAFVHLTEGTTNRLTDAETYGEEPHYINGTTSESEDRKGCLFSEGNLIFSGTGVLVIEGNYRHGIATDGYFHMRPGVTIAVTSAAKNAIHAKGDTNVGIGVSIAGGLVYANVSSTAGKCIKTDSHVEIAGGKLQLNTSGNAVYDTEDGDTSSAACIKADGNVKISGGTHTLKSTGTGGKGMNADGEIYINGGETTITTTGSKFYYSSYLTSSPKGLKADGNISISDGKLNICVTGISDGSEGLESKSSLTICGGEVYSYAYDDAINAASAIDISGGNVYAYSSNNDGIDSNGSLTISGGTVIGIGASAPEGGIDCDNSNLFSIDGGTVIGFGGTLQSNPSAASSQRSVVYNGIEATKGSTISVLNDSATPILTFEFPRTLNGATFFFSTPDIVSGTSYTLSIDGSQIGSFTSGSVVTTIGNSNMPGEPGHGPEGGPAGDSFGGPGDGGPGGWPGGRIRLRFPKMVNYKSII